ncbi:MAG: hypothetical protein ACYS83_10735 [Planctomycetota bacterium]
MKVLMRTIILFTLLNSVTASSVMAEKAVVEVDVKAGQMLAESLQNVEPRIEQLTKSIVLATTSQYGGAGRVLVIPTEETKVQDIITIMEDLSVMSRILDKKLRDADLCRDCGFFYGSSFLDWNAPVTKSIYLEGYGVLFLKKVGFPLSPASKPKNGEEAAEGIDLVWEQARREMYFGRDVRRHRRKKGSSKEYDAKKVEELKNTLFESLRHAANIRNLKPEEWIIVTVTGSGGLGGENVGVFQSRTQVNVEDKEEKVVRQFGGLALNEAGFSSSTVMTIRVRKMSVDGFAKGEADFDEFREQVQIFTY